MKECNDAKCSSHGTVKTRGRAYVGRVLSTKMRHTAIIWWERKTFIKKYERYEKSSTKVKAHNPPCINAKEGDMVRIVECRPLSKTKNFIITEILEK